MPRKQNGFGAASSFAFKGSGRVDKGKPIGSFGQYPRDRRYGTSVYRTVIEDWNLNSSWTKWRRGYELYNLAAFAELTVLNENYNPGLPISEDNPQYRPAELSSKLYQGTDYEIETLFRAIEMPTMKSDNNTHYVVKRFVSSDSVLGTISSRVTENQDEQKEYNEVWFKGIPDLDKAQLLLQMYNERLTDGETEATLKTVLTKSTKFNLDIPATYKGKTPTDLGSELTGLEPTTVKVRIPLENITVTERPGETKIVNQGLNTYTVKDSGFQNVANDYQKLIGKLVYIKNFFVEDSIDNLDSAEWIDYDYYFGLKIEDIEKNQEVIILDPGVSVLPPSMYDIQSLPSILKAGDCDYEIKGGYAFLKEDYQRYFKRNYLTADVVKDETDEYSYSVFPFTILGAEIVNGFLELVSIPFTSEIKLYSNVSDGTLVFGDRSFAKYVEPSNPATYIPGKGRVSGFDKAINTNVDVWQDEVFTSGNPLRPADVYSCDCASYSKTILTMPQATQDSETRKTNRQYRYPLPAAQSGNRFDNLGIDKVAGKAASWFKPSDHNSFRLCKHTVTAMFVDGVQLIEPSQYPTQEERDIFEQKLEAEIENLSDAWRLSAERGGISLTEIVFSLAQGLNLDDVETGYVVFNSS